MILIALVIALALIQLLIRVPPFLIIGTINSLDHTAFQGIFGMMMTVLIAFEFKHTIICLSLRRESIRPG